MTKRVALLCVVLVVLTAAVASAAGGVNVRWNDCLGDGGVPDRVFACDRNSGTNLLDGSFVLGADLAQVSGLEIVVDIATAGPVLPAWWQFKNAGTCRQASLNMSPTANPFSVACVDWTQGSAAGGTAAYTVGSFGPSTARIVAGFGLPTVLYADLVANQEYFAFNGRLDNAKTVGTGACDGCTTPACIVCTYVRVVTPPVAGQPSRDVNLSGPTNNTDSNFVTWQGGAGVSSSLGQGCPAATPTQLTTWSRVKTLYR